MLRLLVLIGFIFPFFVFSQQMRIGVLRDYSVERIVFAYSDGSYNVFGDTTLFATILPSEFVDISITGNNQISLKIGVNEVAVVSKVLLVATKLNQSLVYSTKTPVIKERKYKDDVEITVQNGALTIVNLVDINNYLSGVVESEGGGGKEIEYYKVQALMSRTYALKYKTRHQKEGFDLCDRTHCQAYHNQLRLNPMIDSAVLKTEGMVMVDQHNHLVDAYFHANCGGQTSEPDYVWNNKIPYLSTFKDTFCIYTKQATWERRIPQTEWLEYLVRNFHYPVNDSVLGPMIYTFNQPDRCAFYQYPWLGIPLRDIRENFKLKSTFFNCYPEGTDVILRGRGYGHGVGLCQEGAMKMARFGFNYIQIALYYFPGVKVVNYQEQQFFNQKPKIAELD
ncbi:MULTISPECIES: SpoIID/LytB domain-containing protein [Fluviicola]|uniref:SpoIID/LytB domain-containing protein n=1 Tax=Fluviicola TaxID=332102 RepID=UPI003137D66E